ncbi:MAG: hypothetical protein CBC74_007095 [Crocinitomicaceae bacterium TMED114]|nr:MAG: hypothetical protein CBC74_007095 [Crocinitomicaceae bacterium TMED114]
MSPLQSKQLAQRSGPVVQKMELPHWWNGPEFTWTNYNCNVMTEPHALQEEVGLFNLGWFVRQKPDLAPDEDPLRADLLAQNELW